MNSKDFNNDAEREGAADSTSAQGSAQTSSGFQGSAHSGQNAYGQNGQSAYGQAGTAQGRPGQTFQGTGYQNGPAFQAPGYQGAPGTYGQSGMDRFFNSIRAMNLYRAQPRVLGGVCSGISQRYGIDMTLMRILFIVAALLGFGGFLYALAWAFLPEVEDGRIHVEQALHGDFTGGLAGAIVLALFSGAPASVSIGFLPSFFGNSTLIGIAAVVAVLLIANSRRNSQNYSGYPYGPGGYDGGAGYGPDGGNGGGTGGGYGSGGVGSENYDPNGAYASTRGYDGGVGPNEGYNSTYNGSYGPNSAYNGGEGQQVFSAPPVGSNGKPVPRWQGNYNAGGPRPIYQPYQPYQRKNWAPGPGSMLSLITLGLLVMCAIPMVLEQSLRSLVISAALAAGVMGLALAVCAVRGRHGGWISVMAVFSLIFGFMPIAAVTSAAPQSALDIDWQNVRVDKSNYNYNYMVPSIPNFVGETTLDLTQAPAGENRTITVNSFVGQLTIKTAYGQSVRIEMDHSKGVEAATLSAYSPWQVSENGVVHTLQPTNTYNSIDGDDSDDFDDDAGTPTPRNWVTASPSTAATSPSGTAVASPSTAVATPSGTASATPGSTVASPGATASSSSRPFAMYYYEKSTVNGWPSGSGSKLIFSSPSSVQGTNAGSSKGTITVKVGQAVGQVRTIESAPTSN